MKEADGDVVLWEWLNDDFVVADFEKDDCLPVTGHDGFETNTV